MGFNKKFFQTGGIVASSPAAAAAFDPLQNFETVTYTGNGGTQKITGYIRKGAGFNGSSSTIDLNLRTTPSSGYSIAFWVYADDGLDRWIFGDGVAAGSNNSFSIGLKLDDQSGTTQLKGIIGDGSDIDVNDFGSFESYFGSWRHIAMTVANGGTTVKVYVDGSQFGSTWTSSRTMQNGANDLCFGTWGVGNTTQMFDGRIDQIRIFDTELNSTQVAELALETYASSTKSTTDFGGYGGVVLYELDEDANATANYPYGTGAIDSGQSAYFAGSVDSITGSGFSSILGTNRAFSISGWFYPSSSSNGLDAITAWYTTGTTAANFVLGRSTSGTWQYRLGHANSNEMKVTFSDNYIVDSWTHVVFTYDGSKDVSGVNLYLNGSLATVSSVADNNLTTNTDYNNFALGYGAWAGDYYNGYIDQVRIYSSELSSSDVEALVSETSVPTSTLVAHYKLDGNANDETTNYNLSTSGATYVGSAAEFPNTTSSYNGTATNVNFLGMAFQPDLIWTKNRSTSSNHGLIDSVRGSYVAFADSTDYEYPLVASDDVVFDSNGFTINSYNGAWINSNGDDFVAWCWKAGGVPTPNNNTQGTITSTVSANQDAGFSIVKWSANGSVNDQLGHGLSSTPELIIYKALDTTSNWWTLTTAIDGSLDYLKLDTTDQAFDQPNTSISSTTISNYNFSSTDMIAYCFHSVDGYQKIGSYTSASGSSVKVYTDSNGDGTGTGAFKPRFVMIKLASGTSSAYTGWVMFDYQRDIDSDQDNPLYANSSQAEGLRGNGSGSADDSVKITFDSDGFTVDPDTNNDGETNAGAGTTYIYLAIA